MEFQHKKYTFRGTDGFADFRHDQEYALELGTSEAEDEHPAEVVIINDCKSRPEGVDVLQQARVRAALGEALKPDQGRGAPRAPRPWSVSERNGKATPWSSRGRRMTFIDRASDKR